MRSSVGNDSALNRIGGWRLASRLVLVAAVLGLAGCGASGFRPMYGSLGGAAADAKMAQVAITIIPGRVGQQIRNELIFQATGGGGEVADPVYRLDVAIRQSVTSTLVKIDGDSSSQIFNLEAKFQLIRVSDKTVVMSGTSYGRAGFERDRNSVFAHVRAREDAENRAAKTVAEDLKVRLSAHLAGSA